MEYFEHPGIPPVQEPVANPEVTKPEAEDQKEKLRNERDWIRNEVLSVFEGTPRYDEMDKFGRETQDERLCRIESMVSLYNEEEMQSELHEAQKEFDFVDPSRKGLPPGDNYPYLQQARERVGEAIRKLKYLEMLKRWRELEAMSLD